LTSNIPPQSSPDSPDSPNANPNASTHPDPPSREVICADALTWLRDNDLGDASLITSLPDVSAFEGRPDARGLTPAQALDRWQAWFTDAVDLCLSRLAPTSVGIFYQTDIKRDGAWIDKGFLCQLGAQRAGSTLLWHKVVCRAPAGQVTFNRPAYSHMLCFSKRLRLPTDASTPDVLPSTGHMTWPQAMGVAACEAAVRFILSHTPSRLIIDPFCGHGTALAVANAHGLSAIGVDLSPKMCRFASQQFLNPSPLTPLPAKCRGLGRLARRSA
jgi:hypothetical protein